MAITEAFFGGVTITTEYSLTGSAGALQTLATPGIYQLFLGLQNLASGDCYLLKIKEKVQSTSTQAVVQSVRLTGAQAQPAYVTESLLLKNGWDMTLTQVSGTARLIEWSIRQVA